MMNVERLLYVIRRSLRDEAVRRRQNMVCEEPAYLPAALEIVERPVSPTARITAWALISFFAMLIVWLVVGKLDVVVSAQGKILPNGNSKLVQAALSGTVSSIAVKDGDYVKKGQLLAELDGALYLADLQQAQKSLLAAQLEVERYRAIANLLEGRDAGFHRPPGAPPEVEQTERRLIGAKLAEVRASVAGYDAARRASLADAKAAIASISRLDETTSILDKEVVAMQRLDALGYAPGLRLFELQRQLRAEIGERDVADAQVARARSESRKFSRLMVEALNQARSLALAELSKAEADVAVRREQVGKALHQSALLKIVSPVDGMVQQLQIHTIGGVVERSRVLMVVVPQGFVTEVEAHILNRDIGFVRIGQRASVKIDAFPFTRYGSVPGRLVSLSRDTVPDPKLGATYTARIRLDRSFVYVGGSKMPLMAGQGLTADIRTGSRSILSWLISPILATAQQAARER